MVQTHLALSKEEKVIHELLIKLSGAAEEALELAMTSYLDGDQLTAQQVIENDASINDLCRKVEEQCLTSIALRQPVANDLRDLLSSMQIAIELERIGDYAADIARTTLLTDASFDDSLRSQFEEMTAQCLKMLGSIMTIYQDQNVADAKALAMEDDQVDASEQQIRIALINHIKKQPGDAEACMHSICTAHKLERTADRVTNIAERIVFAASGDVVALD